METLVVIDWVIAVGGHYWVIEWAGRGDSFLRGFREDLSVFDSPC